MPDTATPTPALVPAPDPPAPAPAAPVQVPEGFVPQADLDRVELQRKGFQSELTRVTAELAAAKVKPDPAPATSPVVGDAASELRALRAEMVADRLLSANMASVPSLKTEFPHADPSFFSAERLAGYGSPEALRIAVEADHNRIAAIVSAAEQVKEDAAKAALAGQSPLGPVAPPIPGVDPTVQQLNALSPSALDAYQAANPGVVERVMTAAMAASA